MLDNGFVDIHAHIIPGVDDGPKTIDESLKIIEAALRGGTSILACTSHIREGLYDNSIETLRKKFEELVKKTAEIGLEIKLAFGAEIHVRRDLCKMLNDNLLPTYSDTGKYILLEFPMGTIPDWADEIIFELKINDIIPIIAHPERSVGKLKNLQRVYDLVYKGAMIQLNSTSIVGGFGKNILEIAMKMVQLNLVHFVASDAHLSNSRSPDLSNAFNIVCREFDKNTAEKLFKRNPRAVIEGSQVVVQTPQRYSEKSLSIFEKIKMKVLN